MQKNSHYLRRLRRFAFYSIAAGIVLLAVLMSILRLVVSGAETWRMDLQQLGSYYLERQVVIKELDARLDGLVPVLVLKNVHVMSADGKMRLFSFSEGTLGLDIIGSLRSQTFIPAEFTVQGAEITVIRHKDGHFSLKGIELNNPENIAEDDANSDEFVDWLFQRTDLNVSDSTVIWIDQFRKQPALRLDNVSIHLHNDGNHHQLKASLKLPEALGRKLEFSLDAWGKVATAPSDWRGKLYLRGDGIHSSLQGILPTIQNYKVLGGLADFKLWGDWRRGKIEQLSGDITAYNTEIQHPDFPQNVKIKLVGGLFYYRRIDDGWTLDVNHFHYMDEQGSWPQTDISIQQHSLPDSEYKMTHVQADIFQLENIAGLLQRTAVLSKEQTDMLLNMKPSGDVENISFRFSNNSEQPDISLQAQFFQLGFQSWKEIPGVYGLSGDVIGTGKQMMLNIHSNYAVFNFPSMFREPLTVSGLSGMFAIQRYEQGWQLSTDSLLLKNEDIETNTSVLLDLPDNETSPFMDLQMRFKNANVAHASRYYPVSIISSGLLKWLDRGIAGGRVVQGGAVFRGRLDDFPFKQNEGQLRVEFEAENAAIDYLQGWPAIYDGHFNAVFTEKGMYIEADRGRILDSQLSTTTIEIKNFLQPNLSIVGDVKGEVGDALRFLVESPIQPQAKSLLDSMHYHGRSLLELDLSIPLDDVEKTQPLAVNGQLHLQNAELLLLDELIDITEITGSIAFTEKTQTATDIRARIMGGEARIDIAKGEQAEGGPVVIHAKGKIDSRYLAKKFGLPAWQQIQGITDWDGDLTIQRQDHNKTVLQIRSQMNAVEINLPQPLGKTKDESREALLEVQFAHDGHTRLYAHLKNYVSAAVMLDTETRHMHPLKAYIHFGAGEGQLPDTESLQLSGNLQMFSLTPWVEALEQANDDVTQSFVALPLIFAMESLQLAPEKEETTVTTEEKSVAKFDASSFPLIQGSIEKLSYDDVAIGRLEIHTSRLPIRKGIQLDSLTLQGKELNLQASGEWVQWPHRDFSSMEVKLDSADIGVMLSSLGFSAIFDGGETALGGTLNWSDSPMGFSLTKLNSKLKYTVKDGSIVNVEPGAGRLLGLFSLAALPRRLILDFSDAFGDGLHFDSIDGELDIRDGNVFMDNNLMKSPLAYISVSGRTGLVDRDFDQLITVNPRGGDALTAVAGGMLFGPQIGAAILLIQKIIGTELEDATAIKYEVTGSWEKPVITRLGKPQEPEGISLDDDF